LIIRSLYSRTTRGRVHGRLPSRASPNGVDEISAYSGRGGTCGWYVFKRVLFRCVVLRHLMVVGMPSRRHWPVRFRTSPPRISTFNNLGAVQLSVWCEIIRFTNPVAVTDPLFTRNPPYRCTHRRGRGEAQQVRNPRSDSPDERRIPCATQSKSSSQSTPRLAYLEEEGMYFLCRLFRYGMHSG